MSAGPDQTAPTSKRPSVSLFETPPSGTSKSASPAYPVMYPSMASPPEPPNLADFVRMGSSLDGTGPPAKRPSSPLSASGSLGGTLGPSPFGPPKAKSPGGSAHVPTQGTSTPAGGGTGLRQEFPSVQPSSDQALSGYTSYTPDLSPRSAKRERTHSEPASTWLSRQDSQRRRAMTTKLSLDEVANDPRRAMSLIDVLQEEASSHRRERALFRSNSRLRGRPPLSSAAHRVSLRQRLSHEENEAHELSLIHI